MSPYLCFWQHLFCLDQCGDTDVGFSEKQTSTYSGVSHCFLYIQVEITI